MPKRATKIIHATEETIILETTIGTDYRLSVPKAIRHQLKPTDKVRITINRLER